MTENFDIFDFMGEEGEKFKPIKATDWKWSMADDYPKEKNGLKVFSCFACGGGSTMGYKLAGCEVLGCVEIDPRMNDVYLKNHHPKHNFLMDIRDFNNIPNEELPPELFNLDILDGSPPCTTFSMAGDREDSWGKKKKFREGQTEQTLDDLSFIFIDTVEKLKPKCVVTMCRKVMGQSSRIRMHPSIPVPMWFIQTRQQERKWAMGLAIFLSSVLITARRDLAA